MSSSFSKSRRSSFRSSMARLVCDASSHLVERQGRYWQSNLLLHGRFSRQPNNRRQNIHIRKWVMSVDHAIPAPAPLENLNQPELLSVRPSWKPCNCENPRASGSAAERRPENGPRRLTRRRYREPKIFLLFQITDVETTALRLGLLIEDDVKTLPLLLGEDVEPLGLPFLRNLNLNLRYKRRSEFQTKITDDGSDNVLLIH